MFWPIKKRPQGSFFLFWQRGQIVNSHRAYAAGPFRLGKVQTRCRGFSPTARTNCTSSNLGCRQQNKKTTARVVFYFGSPNQIVNSHRAYAVGPSRLGKVQTRCRGFSPTARTNCTSSNLGCRQQNKKTTTRVVFYFGSPNQIRTGVLALKGRCPRPLDDGAKTAICTF